MAELWRGRKRPELASSSYWYQQFLEKGYEAIEDMPINKLHRLKQIRDQLSTDPRIEKVIPED